MEEIKLETNQSLIEIHVSVGHFLHNAQNQILIPINYNEHDFRAFKLFSSGIVFLPKSKLLLRNLVLTSGLISVALALDTNSRKKPSNSVPSIYPLPAK